MDYLYINDLFMRFQRKLRLYHARLVFILLLIVLLFTFHFPNIFQYGNQREQRTSATFSWQDSGLRDWLASHTTVGSSSGGRNSNMVQVQRSSLSARPLPPLPPVALHEQASYASVRLPSAESSLSVQPPVELTEQVRSYCLVCCQVIEVDAEIRAVC